ncbi:MAG TPA: oligoendopeptidase F [candidate division Zixibacteria bacterium]|nr:oligoendopeptidase F [candidate division Zixibacteria bacterium]MDD4917323.1 oligoendopeptidase F [candidate division Zixibacteria bacterium]MDM7971529.1 oligoendopeptidase F [candidate division Zixibacteria bacterium]HOZ08179.1 oligoendopeptidase F [candidate division Zixibacteria bacterium]HPC10677.1 oligoendopeptidase F [candidate division Zixibacteria bacterium]
MSCATGTDDQKTIPTRDQVEERYQWNLADLYLSDEAWDDDARRVEELIRNAAGFAGRLHESPDTLYRCLKSRSDLGLAMFRLYQYAKLSQDIDNRVSKYQAMTDRAAALSARGRAAFAFVEPELLAIDEQALRAMAARFPHTDEYDFYINELIRTRAHVRTQEVEELLALSAQVTRGPETIFTMLDDADLSYPTVQDESGRDVQLTKQRYAKLMESSDRRVRHDAYHAFYRPYREHLNTLGASLAAAVNADVFYARARRFDSCLAAALFGDNIPVSVYRNLIETTEAHLEGMHHYLRVRQRLLKVEQLHTWDLACPLFPEADYEVAYDDAIAEILDALRPLGPTYLDVLRRGFASRWVDVFETAGKASGAFSWGSYGVHPFVLMNYNATVDNMFTLAHEMGHALHSHLSNTHQPYPKAQYSIFVAEVASTLNEGLLLQHLLSKAQDKTTRLYLLNRYIDNTMGTFFNQVLYAHFELAIHAQVEGGGALSPEWLTALWADLTRKYYGPDLGDDPYFGLKWCRIPHFYMTFYVYQYATSYAASESILDNVLAGGPDSINRYLDLLAAGGSDYPIELLRRASVDMSRPAAIESTLTRFADQVAELDRLSQE